MFIGPGSWSFRLPTSHLRHRCKGQHPWSSGKIRFLVGCGNPRFIPRPWIHSNSKLPAPSPQSILYFCEIQKFQLAWMATCDNIPTVNEQGKTSLCASFSVSLVHALWNKHLKCNLATTVGIRLANQSAVLVTGSGAEGTLRSGGVTLWHVTWAAASAVALGTAEVTGQPLHFHCLLIRLAASAWVAVVGGVGCNSHLQLRQMNECCLQREKSKCTVKCSTCYSEHG